MDSQQQDQQFKTPNYNQDDVGPNGFEDVNQSFNGDEIHGFESARGNLLESKSNINKVPQSVDEGIEMTNKQLDNLIQDSIIDNNNLSAQEVSENMYQEESLVYASIIEDEKPPIEQTESERNCKPGSQVFTDVRNQKTMLNNSEYPAIILKELDMKQRFNFDRVTKSKQVEMLHWKSQDAIGIKKTSYIKEIQRKNQKILSIVPKDQLEQLELHQDQYPLLDCRKALWRLFIYMHLISELIIQHPIFENFTIGVILANSVTMMIADPTGKKVNPLFDNLEHVFLLLYSIEMILKILGLGLIIGDNAYLTDSWNILDFVIVLSSYPPYFQNNNVLSLDGESVKSPGLDLGGLRSFRVMRPLRTISTVKGLKILMQALFAAMPLLIDTLIILMGFFLVFSIAGAQLLSGALKKRCFHIQNGSRHPDDLLCGECPGGFFCGKGNENPNYGATNFDNVCYSFLVVFQSVTLEGWSEVQSQVQTTYGSVAWAYFLPLVFIGAFFLLNLTLAVINSKFTEAHNEHQTEKVVKPSSGIEDFDTEMEAALQEKDVVNIQQFITAKMYAKKMVQFLRHRQAIKKIQNQRRINLLLKVDAIANQKRIIYKQKYFRQQLQRGRKKHLQSFNQTDNTKQAEVIKEDEKAENQEMSDNDQLNHDIKKLLVDGNKQNAGFNHQNILTIPKGHLVDAQEALQGKTYQIDKQKYDKPHHLHHHHQLKTVLAQPLGNIGPTHKSIFINNENKTTKTKRLFRNLAIEFDIDNVIPKESQLKNPVPPENIINVSSETLKLSIEQEKSVQSDIEFSVPNKVNRVKEPRMLGKYDFVKDPGIRTNLKIKNLAPGELIFKLEEQIHIDSDGQVSSDSDFELAAEKAGYTGYQVQEMQNKIQAIKTFQIQKDVSKTFKKMLASNHTRSFQTSTTQTGISSTKDGESVVTRSLKSDEKEQDGVTKDEGTEFNQEIENKFAVKAVAKRRYDNKIFREDIDQDFLKEVVNNITPKQQVKKQIREEFQLINPEYVATKKYHDQFSAINQKTEKVDITKSKKYNSTSQNDILENRTNNFEKQKFLMQYPFLQLPQKESAQTVDKLNAAPIRPNFEPYQQKICYEVEQDSSNTDKNAQSENEDEMFAREQPYKTPGLINYHHFLKQLQIPEYSKRSDIMITSTLSLSIFPKDVRQIQYQYRALFTKQQIQDYVDEKNAFSAMVKQIDWQNDTLRDKDKEYQENYMKSFIHRSKFQSKTLKRFKQKVGVLNSTKKPVIEKSKEVEKIENQKYNQNKRACEKKDLPKFDMITANQLLQGKYHEECDIDDDENENQEELDDDANKIRLLNKAISVKNLQDMENLFIHQEFEMALHKILMMEDKQRKHDEIPHKIRKDFGLPEKIGSYDIDFNKVRMQDVSKKKKRPIWSGQDVLPDLLDHSKSLDIIDHINSIRVWPEGFTGQIKRLKFMLRILVNSTFFDSFMTTAVLMNTITLAIDHYGISQETDDILQEFNVWFTWIFIFEINSKLLAIGITKVFAETMNYLDAGVVLLSIFEMVAEAIMKGGSGMSLSAFKTVRMLRTFRVFRITRLLRALQSMQTIIGVISRSYMSFFYITMLMFLFIIIFSLLGTQIFGGQFGDDISELPRGNYDTFEIAFITVFQVLTMENWQTVLFDSMKNDSPNKYIVALYYIMWIFIGNFILLNLFLAILLDSFLEDEDIEMDDDEKVDKLKKKRNRALLKKKRQNKNKVNMGGQTRNKNLDWDNINSEGEDLEDLDEEQVLNIFKEEGILKRDENEVKEVKLFQVMEDGHQHQIECEQAFYLFSKENSIRIFCYKAIKHPVWEPTVQFLIGISSLKLGFDTYFWETHKSAQIMVVSKYVDYLFNGIFICEMVVKLIAHGLVMDNFSYLRDIWNQLDFFIVWASIADMSLSGYDLAVVKIFRMLRVLRPLRVINHNPEMKMIVGALIESMGHIANVLIVVAVVYLIFAIIGVNLYGGKFQYCSIERYLIHTEFDCELSGGVWQTFDENFDNAKNAMITLYAVSSLEGWPDVMIQSLDVTDINIGPKKENQSGNMMFFVIFIIIGSFFLLNFFIGVLFLKFNEAQVEERKGFTDKDLAWKDIQKLILTAEPAYECTNVPKNATRKWFHDIVSSTQFEQLIMSFIISNVIQMALESENMTETEHIWLTSSGYIFTLLFIMEALMKIVAYGDTYFLNSWNKFDFIVVTSSIFDILIKMLERIETDLSWLSALTQLARVARIMRVTRILKLAGKYPGLQAILQTIQFSVPSLTNVMFLLLLVFFMFAILGNFLFWDIKTGEVINEQKNFSNFGYSFLLIFALATGEDWNKIMFDCSRTEIDDCIPNLSCSKWTPWSYWYFIMLVLICSHVMLNLFILVIIQQFEHYYLPKDNLITIFKNDLIMFMGVWTEFTQERYNCKKIKENSLIDFFRKLGEQGQKETSLGFGDAFYDEGEVKKQLLKMGIKSNQGFVYFTELLYRCMRRKYGCMKINKKMQIFELKTQFKIYLLTKDSKEDRGEVSDTEIKENLVSKENGVNPFLAIMNYKISFKTWIKKTRQNIKDGVNDTTPVEGKTIMVEIEREEEYSETDDEEFQVVSPAKKSEKKSNISNSISDCEDSNCEEKQDHLKVFEQQMSLRFGIQKIDPIKPIVQKNKTMEAISKGLKSRSQMQLFKNKLTAVQTQNSKSQKAMQVSAFGKLVLQKTNNSERNAALKKIDRQSSTISRESLPSSFRRANSVVPSKIKEDELPNVIVEEEIYEEKE